MTKIAIIAAAGGLICKLVDHALLTNLDFVLIAINNVTSHDIINKVKLANKNIISIELGEIGKAIEFMQAEHVVEIVFAGHLSKPNIFSLKFDMLGAKLFARISKDKFFGDNKLLSSLNNFLEEFNFKIIGIEKIIPDLVVDERIFTKLLPSVEDYLDIELAKKVIQSLGSLDIGQAVIVENGIVLGVEAIEGTDELIKRCAKLKRSKEKSGVLLKFSKPGQDLRIDLPTIGINTLTNLNQAGFKGLVIEAKKSIFLDQQQVINFADNNHIYVVSKL